MTSHQKRRPSVKTFNSFQSKINRYSSTSKKFAIGFSLREPLANIIVVSQSWPVVKKGKTTSSPKNELKLLPHSNSKVPGPDAGYARLNAAKKVSYDSYFRNYVLPLANRFKRKVSYKSLSSRSNLYSLKSYMKRDKRLFMIHNQDDMWLRGGDVSKLNRIFGRRGFIFPRGGHMGNFWYKDNWQTTLDILL